MFIFKRLDILYTTRQFQLGDFYNSNVRKTVNVNKKQNSIKQSKTLIKANKLEILKIKKTNRKEKENIESVVEDIEMNDMYEDAQNNYFDSIQPLATFK